MAGRLCLPTPQPLDLERIFAARGWLSVGSEALRGAVLAEARALRFLPDERLYHAGDGPGGLYGVVEGSVAAEFASAISGPVIGHVVSPGGWLGGGPALMGGSRALGAFALESSVILHLPLTGVARLVEQDPNFMRVIGVQAELWARLGVRIVAELLIPDMVHRIAATLVRVTACDEPAIDGAPLCVRLSQQQLGEMSGYSRSVASNALRRMESAKLIELTYKGVTVVDREGLIACASGRFGPGVAKAV